MTSENQSKNPSAIPGQIIPQSEWSEYCEWARDGGYDQSYFNRFDSKSVALQEAYLEEKREFDETVSRMQPVIETAHHAINQVSAPKDGDNYFYYISGDLAMKSDGSFTDEKRHWIPISKLDADSMMDNGGKPYGATMDGVFIGTEHGERLVSATRAGEYPFGLANRDDQFHGSRVRVLPELAGDVAWEGTVQCVLNKGRLLSVIRDGNDFSIRVPGDRIEVIERIENGVKMVIEDTHESARLPRMEP